MKRNMELVRKILFAIEEQSDGTDISGFKIDGYDEKTVVYHCKLLYDAGLIMNYDARYADNDHLYLFYVGCLSWQGNEFLDKIRSETIWNKTKETIKSKGLPMIIDVIKDVSASLITAATQAAIKGIIQ